MLDYGRARMVLEKMGSAQTIDDIFGPPGEYEELKRLLDFEDDQIVAQAAEVLESVLDKVDSQDEAYDWDSPLSASREFVHGECNWIENSMWLVLSTKQAQSNENRGLIL